MTFDENSRVKIPTILHLTRLGYDYLPLKNINCDESTNIFEDIFIKQLSEINKGLKPQEVEKLLQEVKISLCNEDLGKAFYKMLISSSGTKLIDFENFDKNSFHVVTELIYKNGSEFFKPDITLLINGMPLIFIEVKKPNNKDGISTEYWRITKRLKNTKFWNFVNITQIMLFSNNMEYDDDSHSPLPIQGAFYASSSYEEPIFNYFREEEKLDLSVLLKSISGELENKILQDNNLITIKNSPEFITNKNPNSPTNRICTSLLSRKRLSFLLQYGFAYIRKPDDGLQKHIMRYPQIFATQQIVKNLSSGEKKGIIWHTPGSGKTALVYYNIRYLIDYFKEKSIIPKFYFIVDRIDLRKQACDEFAFRGLSVNHINTRKAFVEHIKSPIANHNLTGEIEITVVNIQNFNDDSTIPKTKDYDLRMQRVYFLDEVHRSYSPSGSFLASLEESDSNAIKIGLTGTPLIGEEVNSKQLFGNYIHKYYYNSSIADGYTLRLIREEIASNYKIILKEALEKMEVSKKAITKEFVFSHRSFVEPMLDFIIEDFVKSREIFADNNIGGMVICHSSKQAKMMYQYFNSIKADSNIEAAVILHDVGTQKKREYLIDEFKSGKIDLLFVYNMLLTGFNAEHLKKLYLGRVVKKHNLLQALTRVNRPYKNFYYGYVVDFADIRKEFNETNKAYLKELREELGNEYEHYSDIFKSQEEIKQEIEEIKDTLFPFSLTDAEIFSQEINKINDKDEILLIKKTLENAKALQNIIRVGKYYDLLDKIDFPKLNLLYKETNNRLSFINYVNSTKYGSNVNILNIALDDVYFAFQKTKTEELKHQDEIRDIICKIQRELKRNIDRNNDRKLFPLKKALEALLKKNHLKEITQDTINDDLDSFNKIYNQVKEINLYNGSLKNLYNNDFKYVRVHKRLIENNSSITGKFIHKELLEIKKQADNIVLNNENVMDNEDYFERSISSIVFTQFQNQQLELHQEFIENATNLIAQEYLQEFKDSKVI